MQKTTVPTYVLMTAAKNEQKYIERTIQSVIGQTVAPLRWVIASDGSTDRTDEIIQGYAQRFPFIVLVRRQETERRNFGSKVRALRAAAACLEDIEYEFIGNLDADVSFEPEYYEKVLARFGEDPLLGIAGGLLWDFYGETFQPQRPSPESVGGPIQMFRAECWKAVGGYLPLECGCEDGVAEVTARMHGWKVRQLKDLRVLHHRRTGTEGRGWAKICWKGGESEYAIGYHPLFHFARTIQRIRDRPFLVGSLVRSASYGWFAVKRLERPVPEDFVRFLRREEMFKLRTLARRLFRGQDGSNFSARDR